jgi:hypothetical protein
MIALPALTIGAFVKSAFHGFESWLRLAALSAALVACVVVAQIYGHQVSNGTTSATVVQERIAKTWKPAAREILHGASSALSSTSREI